MAIRKRGNKYQVDVFVNGERFRRSAPSPEAAKALEAQLTLGLVKEITNSPTLVLPNSLSSLLDKTYSRYWSTQSDGLRSKQNAFKCIELLGVNRDVNTLSNGCIDGLIEQFRADGNSDKTINRKISALSKVLTYAHRMGVLKSKPYIPRLKETQGRVRVLTTHEEAKLINNIDSNFMGHVVFLLDTGARPNEMFSLSEDRVRDGKVYLQSKGGLPRWIPMTRRVNATLHRYGIDHFSSTPPEQFRKAWQEVATKMGLQDDPEFVPYCLRHTCASRLANADVNLFVIKDWMGHKSIETTLKYVHLSGKKLEDAVKVLENR